MSSFNEESKITPNPSQPQNAPFDSGLGSSITPLSGSFGEGYQRLSCSYELEYYDFDQDGGPLSSLPPASLQLLTTVIDNDPSQSQQVSGGGGENEYNSDSSTVAHSGETGSTSTTIACTTTLVAITTHTDQNSDLNSLEIDKHTIAARIAPKDGVDLSLSSSRSDAYGCTTTANTTHAVNGDSDRCPSDPNPVHNGTTSDNQDENSSESDADQDQNDIPSPILSHARAQPLDIIIRGSVVEDHPEIISERILTDARAYSPP